MHTLALSLPVPSRWHHSRVHLRLAPLPCPQDFFFSYSLDLTSHLQHSMLSATSKTFPPPPCQVTGTGVQHTWMSASETQQLVLMAEQTQRVALIMRGASPLSFHALSGVYRPPPHQDMFMWNHFLTTGLEECVGFNTAFYWVLPLIQGAFIQRR